MSNWVYAPELVACLFFAILLSFTFTRRNRSVRSMIFCAGMLCAILVTTFNILSIWSLSYAHALPPGTATVVNNLYFAFLPLMAGTLIWYELEVMYETADPHRHKKKLTTVMLITYAIHLILLMVNRYNGIIFWFDENEQYHRGPLIILTYMHFVVYVLIALIAFFDQRNIIDVYQKRVLVIVPLLAIAIVGCGYLFPEMQLNGTAMAASALIIFGNFQNRRINTDQLTRLATRDRFYLDLQYMFDRKKPFYIVSVKIANFKNVNRIFGQIIGDRFLKEISIRLRSLDRHARVYRFGGVHFTMIVRDRNSAGCLYEQVAGIFREPIVLGDIRCSLSAAIADIQCPDMASDINDAIESLEYAVSLSVKAGRPVRFDREIRRKRERREHLILLMRRALLGSGFFLEYQPVYDTVQKRYVSAEVLLRLRDDDGTIVSPGEFIPIAEESGLIVDISWLVLDKACSFLHTHSTGTSLSVNMSIQQFQEPGVVAKIMRCIDRYGIHPGQLSLEITERTFATSEDKVVSVMRALTGHGVRFHLDDFGTGYSNLAAVFSMPFQYIKLDRTIINALSHDRRTQLMVRGLIDSFMQTGTGLIAEGVETAETAQTVQNLGIRRIQGFYYSHPVTEENYLALLAEQGGSADISPVTRPETDSSLLQHLTS